MVFGSQKKDQVVLLNFWGNLNLDPVQLEEQFKDILNLGIRNLSSRQEQEQADQNCFNSNKYWENTRINYQ